MSRGFSICMGKGGRGSLRPSYGWPKLTLVMRFFATQMRCNEKLTLLYFWSDCFETNRTWAPILGLHVLFVSKQSDQKYISVNFSLHPNRLHFLNAECVRIPWVVAPKNFPVENFGVRSVLP